MLYVHNTEIQAIAQPRIRGILNYHYIQANEPRSFATGGRPLVGVGGLFAFNSCTY
jgi:hypothetical protein